MDEMRIQISEWLDKVDSLDAAAETAETLKSLRDVGRRYENLISYARRIVQTRLDICTELKDPSPEGMLVSVVAPRSEPSRIAERHVEVELSEDDLEAADGYLRDLVGGDRSHSLDLLSTSQLASYRDRLQTGERTISNVRRQIHERLDLLGSELVRRYQSKPLA